MESKTNIYTLLAGWLLILLGIVLMAFGAYFIISSGFSLTLLGFALIPIILGIIPLLVGKSVIKNRNGPKIAGLIISALLVINIGLNLLTKSAGPGNLTRFLMIGLLITNILILILIVIGMKKNRKLIEYAKKRILDIATIRRNKGLYDVILAFVLSDSGKIYEGTPLESAQVQANVCAERNAVANMVLAETEKAKIKSILIAGAVPRIDENPITPCDLCKYVINEFKMSDTSVLCAGYMRNNDNWNIFTKIKEYKPEELDSISYTPTKW